MKTTFKLPDNRRLEILKEGKHRYSYMWRVYSGNNRLMAESQGMYRGPQECINNFNDSVVFKRVTIKTGLFRKPKRRYGFLALIAFDISTLLLLGLHLDFGISFALALFGRMIIILPFITALLYPQDLEDDAKNTIPVIAITFTLAISLLHLFA